MNALVARLRGRWSVLRARRPRATERLEDALLGARGRDHLVSEVRALRGRLRELERDHLLLAAHVSTLTERAASTAPDIDGEAARQRARLAAVAFYEQRIARLEHLVTGPRGPRRAHWPAARVAIGRTSDEPDGHAR